MAKTHIICILDRSGSMASLAEGVIENFNNFLREQQEVEGKATLTLALFDDKYELVYDEIDIQKAKPIDHNTYFVRGMTAMNDAIGRTLTNKARKKNAIVLVHTDGIENSSKEYGQIDVKQLVKKLKKKWEFIFVGANIDAQQTSQKLGAMRSVQSVASSKGLFNTYSAFSDTSTAYRTGGLVASAAVNLAGYVGEDDLTKAVKTGDAPKVTSKTIT